MKFKIRCKSIKEFDAQKGAYVKCDREVEVETSQVGSLIRCPQCGNDLEVIDPSLLGGNVAASAIQNESDGIDSDDWGDDDPIDLTPESSEQSQGGKTTESPTANEAVEEVFVDPVTELPPLSHQNTAHGNTAHGNTPFGNPAPSNPTLTNPTPTPTQNKTALHANPSSLASGPGADLQKESYLQTSGQTLVPASFGRAQTCHKCGAQLEDKQPVCPICKTDRRAVYVDKQDRKAFSKKGPFGFQLWLDGITRVKNQTGEIDWTTAIGFVFSILLMGSGILFTFLSGIAGYFVGPPVAFSGYAIFISLLYWSRARKNPRTRIPVLGQIAWTIMLFLVRGRRINKLPKEKFLNLNGDNSFGDQQLAARRDLGNFKAIDLDGTSITDKGLLYLYDLRGIQFLVLRNTNVTTEAIHDLQSTIPKTWIWH